MTTPTARIALHTLAAAGGPVTVEALAEAIALRTKAIPQTISKARKLLVGTGATITASGELETLAYRLHGLTHAEITALVGPEPTPTLYRGFQQGTARILMALQAAEGAPISIIVLARHMRGFSSPKATQSAREAIQRIRRVMAEEGSPQTVAPAGRDAFAWREHGPADQDQPQAEDASEVSSVTLPGAYRYVAGRLYLDGQVRPMRVSF